MVKKIDMSVKVCGITFKNPVLPGSSEVACDVRSVKKCLEHGCGGITLKSHPHPSWSMAGRTPRPRWAPMRRFGTPFRTSFMADVGFSWMHPDEFLRTEMPEIVRMCREAKVPLISSIHVHASPDLDLMVEHAKKFADGPDMLELHLACAAAELLGKKVEGGKSVGEHTEAAAELIKAIKKAVSIPVSVKMGVVLHPIGHYAKAYADAGADHLSGYSAFTGLAIDVDKEDVFGTHGVAGYLVGRAFLPITLGKTAEVLKTVKVPVSGGGGIFEPEDALQYLLLGCSTIQIATAIFILGYGQFDKVIKGIEEWMERKGYSSIEDFRGKVKVPDSSTLPLTAPYTFAPPNPGIAAYTVEVDLDKCTFCGNCTVCLCDVFEVDKKNKRITIHDERCENCGLCVGICPTNALELFDRETREVVWDNWGMAKKTGKAHG